MTQATLQPRLQALILADHVYADAQTGKKVIAGTFNRLLAGSFPTQFSRSTFAYISITDVRGKVSLELRYVDNQNLAVLLRAAPLEVEGNDPLATMEFVMAIPPFPMPHPGSYSFELHANGEKLGSVRVQVAGLSQDRNSDR
ncbi:MAG: hypothetical protein AB1726_10070 [Planctomycetota bacterium]